MICCVRETPIQRDGNRSQDEPAHGNVARRDYIRQATTPAMTSTPGRHRIPTTPRSGGSAQRSLSWTPLARRRSQMEHSMLTPPPERQRKALVSLASWEDI